MTDQPSAQARTARSMWIGIDPAEDDPRPMPLTRARTVRAALQLVDDQGLTALTMRALATELKVSPMALYNHVQDKEELVDLMLDLMLGEVDCSATSGDPLTQLRALVREFHNALSAHPHLARIYSNQVRIGPHGLRIIDRALRLLLDAGFSPEDASTAFFTLYTYTVGFHQIGRVAPFPGQTGQDDADFYVALPSEEIPAIQVVSPHLGGVHQPGVFEYGLDTLFVGLRAQLNTSDDGTDSLEHDPTHE